jgi:2-polyprenyl-3-methyl-5-hydroxy-6-metoxy-1,4-benzoquinol methylase
MSLRWKIAQWFELQWWKVYFYNKSKATYFAWKRKYWEHIFSKIDSIVKTEGANSVIDFGCGPAGVFIALKGKNITAVDPLINEYQKWLTFFEKADYPKVSFVNCAVEDFASSQKFDLAFCMNAINHVKDIDKAFDAIINSLEPGGHLVLSIDAHNHSFFKKLFRLVPGDILHPHQYDLEEYQLFLERRGMKLSKTELVKTEFFFNHYLMVATLV